MVVTLHHQESALDLPVQVVRDIQPEQPMDPESARELLLKTHLSLPAPVPWYTRRQRLLDKLDEAGQVPLVLVSAPAGTGKTALLADWVRSGTADAHTGWVTLRDADDALWPLLFACFEGLGLKTPAWTGTTRGHLDHADVTTLATTIAAQPVPVTLVLDGYEFASAEATEDLDFLIRCADGSLRVVVAGRVDPAVPLYRYRLEGSILEVRGADLAFDDQEARALLKTSGVELSLESTHDLNTRTRGWAAGLRFAARALAGRDDADRCVAEVVAATTDVNEYLVGEVLNAQTPEARQFLLQTSVPDTLFPGLVEEICGPGSRRTLLQLVRLNTFLEPVTDQPGCYRYHPFFRDLLRAELAYESPERMQALQRTTGEWFNRNSLLEPGVKHLSSAGLWEEAAGAVVEGLAFGRLLTCDDQDAVVRVIRGTPSHLGTPNASLARGLLAAAAGHVRDAGHEFSRAREASNGGASPSRAFLAALGLGEAVRARVAAPPERAVELAEGAEQLLNDLGDQVLAEHPELVLLARVSKGVAEVRAGRLAPATRTLIACADAAVHDPSALASEALGYLALVDAAEGRLSQAVENAAQAVATSNEQTGSGLLNTPVAQVALALVALDRYDIDAAREHLDTVEPVRHLVPDPLCRSFAALASAGVQRAIGRLPQALNALEAARASLPETDSWLTGHLTLEAARVRVAAGAPSRALQDLSSMDPDNVESSVVCAQALLDEGRDDAAAERLERVQDSTDAPLRTMLTSLLVAATRECRRRTSPQTRAILLRSLRLAAPERMRRPFLEATPELQQLLWSDPQLAPRSAWLRRTSATPVPSDPVAGFPSPQPSGAAAQASPDLAIARDAVVVESLTPKEVEVLGHLAEMLSTEEIASAMFVSMNTVRTHVRNILRKLGVSRRNAAVRHARALGIIG